MSQDAKKEAGRQGGLARKDALSAPERKAIAAKAALARWGAQATHKGSFKEEFGIDVECYVLNDQQKTAVISQRGMGVALGFSTQGGGRFPKFINGKTISPYLGLELKEKLQNPLVFQWSTAVSGIPSINKIHGFDVTLLIDVCKAIVAAEADGRLTKNQQGIAKQAHIILNASAKAGIKGLVYALSGYDATKEEVIAAFKLFVQQEARDYEREFPPQLYSEWYRLYQLPKPERGRPWKAKHLTVDHVYHPLARSNGKILKLTREQRDSSTGKDNKLHQFLSEIGVKALRTHLGQVLGIARISKTREEYEHYINTLFGVQPDLFDQPN
jgi:hypothetical protein